MLRTLQGSEDTFAIKTYRDIAGLKQMLWNELTTKGEICMFSCGNLSIATGKTFAEKFRAEVMDRGIMQRSLENPGPQVTVTELDYFSTHYKMRLISPDILKIQPEITIHDDTISIYNNWNSVRLGTEIKNPFLARLCDRYSNATGN